MRKIIVYVVVAVMAFFLILLSYSVYKKQEFEASVSDFFSHVLQSNRSLVLSIDGYSYSIIKMQPTILGVKIKNTKTLAEIKIERLDMSISEEGNGSFELKYSAKNITLNKRIVYKGADLTRYGFQKNVFDLMSGKESDNVTINLYGKTSYKNGGKRVSTQNVIEVAGVFKLFFKTDINDFHHVQSDAVKAIFGGNDSVFYKTLSKLINRVYFFNTAISLETDSPEKIYYDVSSLFLSMDKFDSKRQIGAYDNYVNKTDQLNTNEKLILQSISEKIKKNTPLRLNLLIDSDYNITRLITTFREDVKTRDEIQKSIKMRYYVD